MKQRSRAIHRIGSILVVVILLLQLFGCASSWSFITEDDYSKKTVKIDGKLYRAGFYSNDLWPKIKEHPVDGIKVGRVTYYPVELSGFECLHAPHTNGTTNGLVYCLDSQWEEAKAYYEDQENFSYYCDITTDWISGTENSDIHRIDDMDPEKFEDLKNWAEKRNDPFDALDRTLGEIEEADPIYRPSLPEFYGIFFYKESNDGNFVTFKGDEYTIVDGKLYYIRNYNAKEKMLHVIEMPEETADYFIDLVNSLDSPYRFT